MACRAMRNYCPKRDVQYRPRHSQSASAKTLETRSQQPARCREQLVIRSPTCNCSRVFDGPLDSCRATLRPVLDDVRLCLKSGHSVARSSCPLCATSGLMHRSKKRRYSITHRRERVGWTHKAHPCHIVVDRLRWRTYCDVQSIRILADEGWRGSDCRMFHSATSGG